MYNASTNEKKMEVATLISHRPSFTPRKVVREEGHYIIIKGIYLQEDNNP